MVRARAFGWFGPRNRAERRREPLFPNGKLAQALLIPPRAGSRLMHRAVSWAHHPRVLCVVDSKVRPALLVWESSQQAKRFSERSPAMSRAFFQKDLFDLGYAFVELVAGAASSSPPTGKWFSISASHPTRNATSSLRRGRLARDSLPVRILEPSGWSAHICVAGAIPTAGIWWTMNAVAAWLPTALLAVSTCLIQFSLNGVAYTIWRREPS